jgi:hypothetical protein
MLGRSTNLGSSIKMMSPECISTALLRRFLSLRGRRRTLGVILLLHGILAAAAAHIPY